MYIHIYICMCVYIYIYIYTHTNNNDNNNDDDDNHDNSNNKHNSAVSERQRGALRILRPRATPPDRRSIAAKKHKTHQIQP